MDFSIQSRQQKILESYIKDDLDIVYAFSKEIIKEAKDLVKGIIIFGSTVKSSTPSPKHDIDVLLILDDVRIIITPEIMETFKIILGNVVQRVSTKLHITTLKFSTFWEYVRVGDPVAVNILRDGAPIVDYGFFEPLQILLYQGRIRPSYESIWTYFNRAPKTLSNSKWHILQGTLDLYWAVIDSSHAVLMRLGHIPPSPEHVSDLFSEKVVKAGYMDKDMVNIIRQFYRLAKMIQHGEIRDIKGSEFDEYHKDASFFVDECHKFINDNQTF
ncbi:hypothetical protein JXM83_04765 [Candidatus Woesearchaeota archaeon]|nr:hypothetical protein [Candidatus Woesearchaeota archaeon]